MFRIAFTVEQHAPFFNYEPRLRDGMSKERSNGANNADQGVAVSVRPDIIYAERAVTLASVWKMPYTNLYR
ncbi:MAG: hypothetical protein LBS35_06525 [Synergistaceae bacterium]|jgi:hypothetical protein|nr:hypothetical protein [Synergistaceae bacterium]